jgi:hypothetical protein
MQVGLLNTIEEQVATVREYLDELPLGIDEHPRSTPAQPPGPGEPGPAAEAS